MTYRVARTSAGACPRCNLAMHFVPDRTAAWCEACGGVFVDASGSRRILSVLDRQLLELGFQAGLGKPRPALPAKALTCPECLIEMQRTEIRAANCAIDVCPLHGTWFDTGELESVMRAFAAARKRGVKLDHGPAPKAFSPQAPDVEPANIPEDTLRAWLLSIRG